jgi:signal peptidase I
VPGDRIKIVDGKVFVNGTALNEPYAIHNPNNIDSPVENFPARTSEMPFADNPDWRNELAKQVQNGELVVPAGEYFMMGDNRDNSNDSRYWGFVPRENIIGTPVLIYMSIEAPEDVWEPGHVGERFATYLNAVIHPGEIRWKRLFHIF